MTLYYTHATQLSTCDLGMIKSISWPKNVAMLIGIAQFTNTTDQHLKLNSSLFTHFPHK